jgi:hypothetical protein
VCVTPIASKVSLQARPCAHHSSCLCPADHRGTPEAPGRTVTLQPDQEAVTVSKADGKHTNRQSIEYFYNTNPPPLDITPASQPTASSHTPPCAAAVAVSRAGFQVWARLQWGVSLSAHQHPHKHCLLPLQWQQQQLQPCEHHNQCSSRRAGRVDSTVGQAIGST